MNIWNNMCAKNQIPRRETIHLGGAHLAMAGILVLLCTCVGKEGADEANGMPPFYRSQVGLGAGACGLKRPKEAERTTFSYPNGDLQQRPNLSYKLL